MKFPLIEQAIAHFYNTSGHITPIDLAELQEEINLMAFAMEKLNEVQKLAEHAETKTPCAEHYVLLLRELLAIVNRKKSQ